MKFSIYITLFSVFVFTSCKKTVYSGEISGSEHCEVHGEDCKMEEHQVLIGAVSHLSLQQTKDLKVATSELFPNANNWMSWARPGSEFAKEAEDKVYRRYYCSSCRVARKEWFKNYKEPDNSNSNQ